MQKFEILEHTGDVKIRVWGDMKEELFASAMEGMFAILKSKIKSQKSKLRKIQIRSQDVNALLVDFLNEINYLRQVNREMYHKARFTKFSDVELEGELEGKEVQDFGEDIKGVTFHDLDIQQNKEGQWETFIVFDV